ncbi:MAG: hypothetical protein IPN51_17575 [Chloracidobacterium sp.]|nr:hypothetical protein [Chloracidobacterium sp.]
MISNPWSGRVAPAMTFGVTDAPTSRRLMLAKKGDFVEVFLLLELHFERHAIEVSPRYFIRWVA